MLTAFTRSPGFWIINCASFMNSAKDEPLATVDLKCGNTSSRTTGSIFSAPRCRNCDQRKCCSSSLKRWLNDFPVRFSRFSSRASLMSRRRAYIRNVICSITVRGLVIPPCQNSVQSASTRRLRSPVTICYFLSFGFSSGRSSSAGPNERTMLIRSLRSVSFSNTPSGPSASITVR